MKLSSTKRSRRMTNTLSLIIRFVNTPTTMSDEVAHAVREGITSCFSRGPILGYAMHNVQVSLLPTECLWDPQTPPIVVQSAIISCLSSGLREHANRLMEPIMRYEASVGSDNMGNVVSDLTASM